MVTYSLVFLRDGIGKAQRVECEAPDVSAALNPPIYTTPGRVAELWDGDRKIAYLKSWEEGLREIDGS
ncbi:hypothetical protein [Caenibius sp. WL]|uniref:hypothetical protein n=1 Tax=Caenibius sp. WL TaxID=2872646 RepID=UPI001C9949F2|nr:hypothetical protein [Caenibius sp. WL]QZP08286.1 hypothetical protein K5X80_00190 [Caenibius sp. WL]